MAEMLTLALSKGRIFEETLPLLKAAGIEPLDDPEKSRKLILETNLPDVRLIIVRASDVPTYVEYGGADMGVAGKDVLMEHPDAELYEPVDLNIACCKLMTAGKQDEQKPQGRLKVATKFVESTKRFYAEQGQQVEIIKLYGSMELAPLVGMADRIVDVVDTGNTLRANGLTPMEHIADISSRLVVNKASMKTKHARIQQFIEQIRNAVKEQANDRNK
ncbi:MAG: ATP phosphoribosyltransferase [Methylophaga sp.]|jgi:ATP phosphoribosyltransferase|nr:MULTISPECIES: ATP phosphoribosyltransferase [unclassified Methylophaga]MAK67976.1 ATP phosphoribosyltransferase [Methylophaga sp.]MAY16751.1 ATP phosphoribosyltransferase [Methylophaga sp.]HCD04260.1 ATP phosphoribosyltransferase [Methylophaga sp.]|tara:strand:+ start:15747 stop:16400 length:654 start_codon:yes stop_codon:yes gene_type:complete